FAYLWRAARGEQEEPRLHGVAKRIGDLPRRTRRAAVIGLMLGATAIVLSAAGPFATALVQGGRQLGIDEFLLVQWLAPVSSESPSSPISTFISGKRSRCWRCSRCSSRFRRRRCASVSPSPTRRSLWCCWFGAGESCLGSPAMPAVLPARAREASSPEARATRRRLA